MGGRTGVIAISLMTLAFCCSVVGEIHRAKHTGKVVAQSADQASVEHQENMNTSSNSRLEVWIYSIVGTIFVGLSGIFPLLIIPFRDDTAKNLSNTPGLGLLLSFAVGGLLGDVFLHLLPEAWSHNDDSINDLTYHRYIGFWVLSGIITFLILEQTFSDNKCDNTEEIESQQDYSQKTQNTRNTESSNHVRQRQVDEKPTNKKNIKSKNGCQRNGFINPCDDHSTKTTSEVVQKQVKKEKIKVTGYLNLLANCIDNFTHGLAVAASFLVSTKMGILTTAAIMLHEIPHEIGDFAILLRSGFNRKDAAKAQVMTAAGGLVGATITLLAESAKGAGDSTVWVLPFTSGGFIYIAMVTVVPDLLKEQNPVESFKQVVCLCCGVAVMGLVTLVVD